MKALHLAVTCALAAFLIAPSAPAYAEDGCGTILNPYCSALVADKEQGEFHGLIAVKGQPDVLAVAGRSGTKPGCGDCVWTLVMMCVANTPVDPHDQQPCIGAGRALKCRRGQTAFRLYLSTADTTNRLVDTLCLGGIDDVIPVGDLAAADVARWLKDVTPPSLVLQSQPPRESLAGLATYFVVRPPGDLHATTLSADPHGIVETITIAPLHYTWSWGDGTDGLSTDDPGAPYPDGRVTHTYTAAGDFRGTLTAEWGASYTITVDGQTFGPYDATGGLVPHTQTFTVPVTTAHSHLVSH